MKINSLFSVDTSSKFIIDSENRKRIFHGVNAVYKKFPQVPIIDKFDHFYSLSEYDQENLHKWGFNFIRLLISWEGIEPQRKEQNQTLLNQIRKIIQKAANYNITILLDVHQDLYSRRFCGNGFPDWTVKKYDGFPFPIGFSIKKDEKGFPEISECVKTFFAEQQLSFDVGNAFQNLYDNADGLADKFSEFWNFVVKQFKNESNVIGQEILNEPFKGSIFPNLLNLISGYTERNYLQQLYEQIHKEIRKEDEEKLIFFEPSIHIMPFEILGFTSSPGGIDYKNRVVYSYHVYCVSSISSSFWSKVCPYMDKAFFWMYDKESKNLGVAKFLTEFGATSDQPLDLNELNNMVSYADKMFGSWAYWQFKYFDDYTTAADPAFIEGFYHKNGSLQYEKVKLLSRTQAYAICGEPIETQFSTSDGEFYLEQLNNGICSRNTEIQLSEDFYYQNGFTANLQGCSNCSFNKIQDKYFYEISVPANQTTVIKLKIFAKSGSYYNI